MKNKIFLILFLFISCHHIQDTKYEVLFNKNVTEEIEKAKIAKEIEKEELKTLKKKKKKKKKKK